MNFTRFLPNSSCQAAFVSNFRRAPNKAKEAWASKDMASAWPVATGRSGGCSDHLCQGSWRKSWIFQGEAILIPPKGGNIWKQNLQVLRLYVRSFWVMKGDISDTDRHRAFRQIKRWIEYVAICCCTCALLVRSWASAWGFSFDMCW